MSTKRTGILCSECLQGERSKRKSPSSDEEPSEQFLDIANEMPSTSKQAGQFNVGCLEPGKHGGILEVGAPATLVGTAASPV